MSINSLCDDLLIEIFSYLPLKNKINSELVCKRWRHILLSYCQPKSLRFELLIYKRSNYRVVCKRKEHQFTNFNTIKFKDENDIDKVEKVLYKYRTKLESLCFGFSFFNHFQHLIEHTNCLPVMVNYLQNLDHFQCKSFGDGIRPDLFEKCRFLIMKLKHFSFDYKEEDITKISSQPWIEVLLKYGNNLESLFIKFQRMGIKFPFNLPLPPNLKFLYLPSCDLKNEEFYNLLNNGGNKLQELSLHSISSGILKTLLKEMPILKKLITRIRVDQNEESCHLHVQNLKLFKRMEHFTLNQFISPADTNNQIFSLNYGYWTIIDVLSNCPGTLHLQLKSLPLIRRYSNNGFRSDDEEDNNVSDEEDELLNEHDMNNNNFEMNQLNQRDIVFQDVFNILMNEERDEARFDRHLDRPLLLYQPNSYEFNYINNQFKLLECRQANWSYVEQVTIKLNEKKIDSYYYEALNRLVLCLSEFSNLRNLQIERFSDAKLNTFSILKLVDSCRHLTHLHLGSGRRITPEVVDLFVERAMKNRHKNYELKFKNQMCYNIVLPPNLTIC